MLNAPWMLVCAAELPLTSQDGSYSCGPLATVPYQVIMPLRPRLFTSLAKLVHTQDGSVPCVRTLQQIIDKGLCGNGL